VSVALPIPPTGVCPAPDGCSLGSDRADRADRADGAVGWVHSWDLSTGVDGPGTRLVVFTSGCPMRCLYCQNPDSWTRADGTETPITKIEQFISRYVPFIAVSGGGFTVSGGEPLQQPGFTRRMLQSAQRAGLHTALDTSGFLGRRADDALLEATDLVLLDIKAGTDAGHRIITGRPIGPTLAFARRLAQRDRTTWVRYVLVPGYTDRPDEVDAFIATVSALPNVERVEILPLHTLGVAKYEQLGMEYPLAATPAVTAELVRSVRARMAAGGLPVSRAAVPISCAQPAAVPDPRPVESL
jgi:pyruvate formate lyase activating enzyme